jgi:hypothetical protein
VSHNYGAWDKALYLGGPLIVTGSGMIQNIGFDISGWDFSSSFKAQVYRAATNTVCGTAVFTSADGVGRKLKALTTPFAYADGEGFYIEIIGNGDVTLLGDDAEAWALRTHPGTFAAPPTTINPVEGGDGPDGSYGFFALLDGTPSGGGSTTAVAAITESGRDAVSSAVAAKATGTSAITEAGADSVSSSAFLNSAYKMQQFAILASFVQTGIDSLGHALVGTPVTGDQILLPTDDGAGNTITWEVDGGSHPSLRIASMAGSGNAANLPYKYFNGSLWLQGTFSTNAGTIAPSTGAVANITEAGRDSVSSTGKSLASGLGAAQEGGRDSVNASATVGGAGAPSISLAVVSSGEEYTFTATATDDGGVVSVQFFVNGIAASSPLTSAPWVWQWNTSGLQAGNYNISARATDGDGNTSNSNTIQVAVVREGQPTQGAPFARAGRATFVQKDSTWCQITEK